MKKKHRGNKHAQNRRRKSRPTPPRQKDFYELIDGNLTHYPVAFCNYRKHPGWLTYGLLEVHRCRERKCERLEMMQEGVT